MLFMAMPGDDQWPSLAPIRTSGTGAAYTHEHHAISTSRNLDDGRSTERQEAADVTSSVLGIAHFDASSESDQVTRQSASSSKFSCAHFFTNCFYCAKRKMSPERRRRHRWRTPTCAMWGSSPSLRSMAFSFPAGGIQSFHSSPTTKAQLSGTFPRTLSGKAQHYTSPHTPAAGTSLNRQLSGEIQHFSSPRTPGSRAIHQYNLSTPRTPASGKVQHFSGAIPSPRTPFGSRATSPSSARQKKANFTLIMPPTMAHNKQAASSDQPDEPTSPHVTCIGRVRRQTHCKKLLHTDMITHCHDTIAKKKAITSKTPHFFSDSSTCRPISSDEVAKSSAELASMEACTQRFGRRKLHNLHKIHGFHDDCNVPFEADQGSLGSNQGDDCTLSIASRVAYCREDLVHEDSQRHGEHVSLNDAKCISGHMRRLHKADHDLPANIRPSSSADAESTTAGPPENTDGIADSTDTPLPHTTCSHQIPEYEAHQAVQCPELGLPLSISNPPHRSTDRCLLLLRNTCSRRLSEGDRGPCMEVTASL